VVILLSLQSPHYKLLTFVKANELNDYYPYPIKSLHLSVSSLVHVVISVSKYTNL